MINQTISLVVGFGVASLNWINVLCRRNKTVNPN